MPGLPDLPEGDNYADRLLKLAGVMAADDFTALLESGMTVLVLMEREFERRFPREWAAWTTKVDAD